MAKIVYKPVCSECGTIIDGDVFLTVYDMFFEKIHPSKCKKCGALFDDIDKDVSELKVLVE